MLKPEGNRVGCQMLLLLCPSGRYLSAGRMIGAIGHLARRAPSAVFRLIATIFQPTLFAAGKLARRIKFDAPRKRRRGNPLMEIRQENQGKVENRIRLMVLDQLGLNRLSLARFLASEPGFEIAGDCGTAVEALEVLERAAVDVILLDADFFSAQTDFIPAAREAGYRGQFVILAGSCDARKLALALKLGVSGIFLKS